MSFTGRLFTVAAFYAAFTSGGLLVGAYLKYITETTDVAMVIFGRLHVTAFVFYFVVTLWAAQWLRWSSRVGVVALLASVVPLASLPVQIWLHRTQQLRAWKKRDAPAVPATG